MSSKNLGAARFLASLLAGCLLIPGARAWSQSLPSAVQSNKSPRTFVVKGVIKEIQPDRQTIMVRHEAVSDYMPAMTMPFRVKNQNEITGLRAGDQISFWLQVAENESW